MENTQLAKLVCQTIRSIMKNTLSLEELSYREDGRNDPRYKTYKKHLMDFTYNGVRKLLHDLEEMGLVVQTDYEEDIKNGYREGPSGGSSFINSESLNDFLSHNQKFSDE